MIVVTGASRGLGKAVVERLVDCGEDVIGISRNADDMLCQGISCDVGRYSDVKRAATTIKKMRTPIRAVVNAAGVASMNMAVTTDEGTVNKLIQTNLMGTIHCCQLLAPLMMRRRSGSFINFSTIAVALALKGESIYAASKAGVEGFSRVFAREMADFDIRVNCIAPGPIRTDLLRGVTDQQIKKITDRQILPMEFEKADVCDLVELLLDDRAASISGQVLSVGGS